MSASKFQACAYVTSVTRCHFLPEPIAVASCVFNFATYDKGAACRPKFAVILLTDRKANFTDCFSAVDRLTCVRSTIETNSCQTQRPSIVNARYLATKRTQ